MNEEHKRDNFEERLLSQLRVTVREQQAITWDTGEDGPASYVRDTIEILGCRRIDHGYHVLEDEEVVKRTLDAGIVFTTCPTATAVCYFTDDLTQHPIVEMEKAGLRITVNSDDPPMFHTDIGEEFARMAPAAGWQPAQIRQLCLTAVDASWMDDDEKRAMREHVTRELDELDAQLVA